ncbi:MAG TPA: hypothetical protein VGE52_21245 [Pirellulales bacterium]
MRSWILIDEVHVAISLHRAWSPVRQEGVRRALQRPGFRRRLERAVRRLIRRDPALTGVSVAVSR